MEIKFLEWFKNYIYIGTPEEKDVLRIALVNKSNDLEGKSGYNIIGDYDLSYTPTRGYMATKKKVH
jgi:hypothetical protein